MNVASPNGSSVLTPPFLQDIATHSTGLDGLPAEKVLSVAVAADGAVYAGTQAGLARWDAAAKRWQAARESPLAAVPVLWLRAERAGHVWAGTPRGTYRFAQNMPTQPDLERPGFETVGMGEQAEKGLVTLLARRHLRDAKTNADVPLPEGAIGRAVTCTPQGTIYVATDKGLLRLENGQWRPVSPESVSPNARGKLLSADIHDLVADTLGGLWIATANGLNYYTQGAWLEITGADGLPVLDTSHLALGSDGALWVGTARGVSRFCGGKWRYYAGKRWLPDDKVNALATDAHGNAWVATDGGLAHITFQPMTFAQKAAHYERITAERHNRDGYVTDCHLTRPGDLTSFRYIASDNDGLWTSLYLGAECFRYAVTKDPEARRLAQKSLHALLELVRVTDIPGFPARAIIRKGENVQQSDPGPNWYPSPVAPDMIYKDDTSSDEVDGHYLAWYLYSELVADAQEKQEIAAVCRAVTNHILDHNYTLVGPTGKPTRWGVWSPESLNSDPKWSEERGLNSLEILSHLKVAIHLCGDARFVQAYTDLIAKHHYALNTVNQKMSPPDGEINHSDDELAAVAYYPLLQLETDPHLRALYLRSLERTQSFLRPEGSPFHNVLYSACSGQPCDAESAAQWLRDAPLDLRDWRMTNSRRADVTFHPEEDRFRQRQLTRSLPPNEKRVSKWNSNPYLPDEGGNGGSEEDRTFWLLPYWMGRYHGIFREAP